jgi:hypothetical protein
MSQISVNDISSLDGKSGPVISGITTVSSTGYMMVPAGPTEYRGGRGRGIFAGGNNPTVVNTIEYITISTLGDSLDFGDLNIASRGSAGYSSATRGFISGGQAAPAGSTASIRYVEIQSTGNSFDFGNLTDSTNVDAGGCADSTRGLHIGAIGSSNSDTVNYITMASKGNATEFGKLIQGTQLNGCTSNSTRGISCGGNPSLNLNTIEFCTIQTTGNFQDFGDLISRNRNNSASSDGTRGVIFGGIDVPSSPVLFLNTIQYITIASLGDAIDFGDLSDNVLNGGSVENKTRGVYYHGSNPSGFTNTIEYITIQTLGNAQDFGDMKTARAAVVASCSDAHGGLG